jgi:general secretion pathway protein N
MRPLLLFASGTVAFAVFLVVGMPATFVASRAAALSGGRVTVAAASGTLLEGNATLDVRTPAFGTWRIEALRWAWRPARLLAGQLAFDVDARLAGFTVSAEAARSLGDWQLREVRGSGDASALAALFPFAASWQPAGALTLDAAQLAFDGKAILGNAASEWRDASMSLSTARPLGSWRATLAGDGGPAKVTLATTRGPLRLAGNGTLSAEGRLAFAGEARAETGREAEVEPVLDLIGPRRADGARTIEVR